MPDKRHTPIEIKNEQETGIRIKWADAHEAIYENAFLRESCQCASCVDEWSGKKRISPEDIPANIKSTEINAIGQYAISIHWTDGHNTGIYPFDYLRKICPCQKCSEADPSH